MAMMHPAAHVIQHLQPDGLADDELETRIKHSDWIVQALGHLLQQGPITHKSIMMVLAQAMQRGALKPDEMMASVQALPENPQHLPVTVGYMHQVASHAGTLMKAEQHFRTTPASKVRH